MELSDIQTILTSILKEGECPDLSAFVLNSNEYDHNFIHYIFNILCYLKETDKTINIIKKLLQLNILFKQDKKNSLQTLIQNNNKQTLKEIIIHQYTDENVVKEIITIIFNNENINTELFNYLYCHCTDEIVLCILENNLLSSTCRLLVEYIKNKKKDMYMNTDDT